ncbi:MAG: hypothetical protein JST39_09485 [Bacteroidetes bacterium]|nr:hypothetical protein [Bacteroidota bacterium]
MKSVQPFIASTPGQVNTMHVLSSGEIIDSLEAYEKVADRFAWVNRSFIIAKILQLRQLTDDHKQSVIVLYEEGQRIREFVNVDEGFRPLRFC